MKSLGYWNDFSQNWKPDNYASFWEEKSELFKWYKWMYESRKCMTSFLFFGKTKKHGNTFRA